MKETVLGEQIPEDGRLLYTALQISPPAGRPARTQAFSIQQFINRFLCVNFWLIIMQKQ